MKTIIILLLTLCILSSCSVREVSSYPTEKIKIGPGPEDMLSVALDDTVTLLVSCTQRRENHEPYGDIIYYNTVSGETGIMQRKGMPDSLYFQPHGISIERNTVPPLLYTISHEHDVGFHPVYVWEILKGELVFRELIYSPLLHSPNALTTGIDGSIYVVNDAGERGNTMEKIIKLNRADIVRLNKNRAGKWEGAIVAEKLGYPAGINRIGDTLFTGDALHHELHVYKIDGNKLKPIESITGLKGVDNIRKSGDKLYLAGHVKPFKFIGHVKSANNKSPVEVWEYDRKNQQARSVFYTDGTSISAGSTAIRIGQDLYISQVFEPFLLKVYLPREF